MTCDERAGNGSACAGTAPSGRRIAPYSTELVQSA